MEYRRLGNSGLKMSVLSLGSWVTYGNQLDLDKAILCMKVAYDSGANFFDNAEAYAGGRAEEIMGEAFRRLGWRRSSYIVSTKFYFGIFDGPNERRTLNRKKLRDGIDGSLKRLGLDYIDLVFCHRPDPDTPIEEVARSMSMMIDRGQALYWGTSEWSSDQIMEAYWIAERYGLHKPQMEQPEYNLFTRNKVEKEFVRLYSGIGLGLTTFSPLAAGVLTGKYNIDIPKDSRFALPGYEWLRDASTVPSKIESTRRLEAIAKDLTVTMPELCLAWCARNPNVSSVITGASRPEQVASNMKALEIMPKLTPDVLAYMDSETMSASDLK
jgi:voltage-dependent potassium channel beta subunit